MQEFIDSRMWLTRGSSIVFDPIMLGSLLDAGALVPLRAVVGWLDSWPTDMKAANPAAATGCKTVVVGGLDTVLEVLPEAEAQEFMWKNVRRFIAEFQNNWDQCGLVFGFSTPAARIEEHPVSEQVFFKRRDDRKICLSTGLWNGSASTDMGRLMRTDERTRERVRGGYYAPRS